MRIVLATLVLACAGRAGDPLVTPVGTSLEAVSVHVDLSGVRTDSAKAVAESYARYIVEQRAAVLRFGALFREAHVAVLRRYYAEAVVEKQRKVYAARKAPAMSCRIVSVKGGEAVLLREWAGQKRRVKLTLEEKDGRWRVKKILHFQGDRYFDGGLGVPPAKKKIDVPKPALMRRNSPEATIRSLRDDMLRLRALQQRGDQRLNAAFEKLLREFLGADVVEGEQRWLNKTEPLPHTFHVSLPSPPVEGVVRMGVVATEPVPGVKGQRTAIGHAGFDLKRTDAGSWRITAELTRKKPDEPLKALESFFGLFFLR